MPFRTLILAAFVLVSAIAPTMGPVAVQESGLVIDLTSSAKKAKVGDLVAFTVTLENQGAESIPAITITLGLPDALDAQAVYCPGDTHQTVTSCDLGEVAAGWVTEVEFFVRVGSKINNGPVTAVATAADSTVIVSDELPPIRIVGHPRPRS